MKWWGKGKARLEKQLEEVRRDLKDKGDLVEELRESVHEYKKDLEYERRKRDKLNDENEILKCVIKPLNESQVMALFTNAHEKDWFVAVCQIIRDEQRTSYLAAADSSLNERQAAMHNGGVDFAESLLNTLRAMAADATKKAHGG